MITKQRRAMTADETELVKRLRRDSREALGCVVAAFLACALVAAGVGGLVGFALGYAFPTERVRFTETGVLVGALAAAFACRNARPRYNRGLAQDLVGGEVELVHVHAIAAASAPHVDAFVFAVEDQRILVVRGHAARVAASGERFPNRYFTLVRLPRADVTLRIDVHGEPLPARVLAPRDLDLSRLGDGAIVPGAIGQ